MVISMRIVIFEFNVYKNLQDAFFALFHCLLPVVLCPMLSPMSHPGSLRSAWERAQVLGSSPRNRIRSLESARRLLLPAQVQTTESKKREPFQVLHSPVIQWFRQSPGHILRLLLTFHFPHPPRVEVERHRDYRIIRGFSLRNFNLKSFLYKFWKFLNIHFLNFAK
jgi:hypothetical protein